jgi:Ca2+-binding RTX toxin-like protein
MRRDVTIYGEAGTDTLHAGSSIAGAPVLDGGPGNDDVSTAENGDGDPTLRGGTGNDVLTIGELGGGTAQGGDGDDRLIFDADPYRTAVRLDGGGGNDTYAFSPKRFLPAAMVPGPGFDTLDQSVFTSPFVQPLVFDMSACPGCVERVIGTSHDDRITGDQRSQAILGGDGNDTLDGGAGPDVIAAQGGDDTVNARDGFIDIVLCGEGVDAVAADRFDVLSRCENVQRGGSRR